MSATICWRLRARTWSSVGPITCCVVVDAVLDKEEEELAKCVALVRLVLLLGRKRSNLFSATMTGT
jgi:hypothetical protein